MKSPNKPENILQRMDEILDELIACQRKEQDLVLQRKPGELPMLCGQINHLTLEFDRQQNALLAVCPEKSVPPELDPVQKKCREKFKLLQELAHQNDLLLENGVRFLQELLNQVLGIRSQPVLYNETGLVAPKMTSMGMFLNQKA